MTSAVVSSPTAELVARAAGRVEHVAHRTLVLRGGQAIDGTGRAPITDAAVVIEGGLITFAGPASQAPSPADAEIVEFPNATLMPGMIDAHVHLTGDETMDVYRRYLSPSAGERPLIAAAHAAVILGAGFTTVRDIGLPGPGRMLRDAVRAGLTEGPRILTAVAAISQTGGHGDWHIFPAEWTQVGPFPRGHLVDGVDNCRRAVRGLIREGADVVKLVLESGGVTNTAEDLHAAPEFSDDELRVLIDEPHRRGLKVAVHAIDADIIDRAVAFGADTIEHGAVGAVNPDLLASMAERGVVLVPTLALFHWVATEGDRWGIFPEGSQAAAAQLPQRFAFVKQAADAGVRIATGTDTGYAMGLGRNAIELKLLVEAGFTPMQAIEASTRVAAEALGLDHTIGTIEAGRLADVIVVDGDPASDIEVLLDDGNPRRVFTTASRQVA